MADENKENRTEQASSRRIQEARNKGQVPQSLELGRVLLLGAGIGFVFANFGAWGEKLLRLGRQCFFENVSLNADPKFFQEKITDAVQSFLPLFYGLAVFALLIPTITMIAQRGWLFLPNRVLPDFSRLQKKSWSEIFSWDSFYLLMSYVIFFAGGIMLTISFFQKGGNRLFETLECSPQDFLPLVKSTLSVFILKIFLLLFFLAAGDLFYRRWKFFRDLQMTPEEVRQEHKEENGSPEMKTRQAEKIRAVGRFQSASPKKEQSLHLRKNSENL